LQINVCSLALLGYHYQEASDVCEQSLSYREPGTRASLAFTTHGKAVGRLSVATNARWYEAEGKECEHTEWHQGVVWGGVAENCQQYLTVGRQVCVEGSLQSRQYEDKNGEQRNVTEIVAQRVLFLGDGKNLSESEPEQGRVNDVWESDPSACEEVPW
jgi:single-strand DNA-binding protein